MSISSSVIVATRNRIEDIITFLDSLKKQTVQPNEILIIDSSDIPLKKNKKFLFTFSNKKFKNSKLIYRHTSPGASYQRNVGIKLASSEIIYFFDDDVILDKKFIEEMNKIFELYPEYAGGIGTIENIPRKENIARRFFKTAFMLQRIYSSGKFTYSGMPTHPYGTKTFKKIEILGAGIMGCRSNIIKQYMFDEHLTRYAYMEDCDLARRISYTYPLFYNPKAKLTHLQSPIARAKIEENRAIFIHNYSYLFFKNFYPKNKIKIVAYWWSIVGLFIEALWARNKRYLKGYLTGLKIFYFKKRKEKK